MKNIRILIYRTWQNINNLQYSLNIKPYSHIKQLLSKLNLLNNGFVHLFFTIPCIVCFFCSPDPKGQVRYCHHLASVVRQLTFHILIYSSETTGPNGTKLGRKHLYEVLYKVSSFRPIPSTNMAAEGNSCFWLANVKKKFSSETAWPNGAKLGRKHLCKILHKTASFNSIRPTNMAAVTKNRT